MKLYNLFVEGKLRLNKELDIVKIIERMRVHDIALRSSVLNTEEKRHQVRHARKYIIDIDSSDDGSEINVVGLSEASFFSIDEFGRPSTPDKQRKGSFNGYSSAVSGTNADNIGSNIAKHVIYREPKARLL